MSCLLTPFWNHRENRPRAGWRLLLQFSLFILVTICYASGMFVMSTWVEATTLDQEGQVQDVLLGLAQSAGMLASVVAAAMWLDRRHPENLGIGRRWWFELALGLLLGALAMVAIFAVEFGLGWIRIDRVGTSSSLSLEQLMISQLGWLALMIGVGYGEEFVSRGYHLKNLAEGLRRLGRGGAVAGAIVLSSLVFGLLHAANDHASLVSTSGIVAAGLMLAVGRWATGSLAAPIGLHISWNYVQGPVLGFPVSGHQTFGSFIAIEQAGDPLWSGGQFGPEAGLVGLIAEALLLLTFLAWGFRSGSLSRNATKLVRYRPPRPPSVIHGDSQLPNSETNLGGQV